VTTTESSVGAETRIRLYRTAARILAFDEKYRSLMHGGEIGGTYYSPRGQEFAAACVADHLCRRDYVVTTYRGVHDQIAKGVPLRDLWAEHLGKATGSCRGKGGPIHVTSPAHGLMLTTGVAGAGLPIANGLALASKLRNTGQVTVANFGDGAGNTGAFHESLNLASIWKLPVVFVCQNNWWAANTRLEAATSVSNIADRADGYSMPGVTVDANDPVALYKAAGRAIDRARRGEGPTLLEALTYRLCGHYFGDEDEYIPEAERMAAVAADPVPRYRRRLLDEGLATAAQLDDIDLAAKHEVDDAVAWAFEQPLPDPTELATDVYAPDAAR
jgi:acetoin:2,6-dichlorophenolindophenol oxidoreductase subunit alpha